MANSKTILECILSGNLDEAREEAERILVYGEKEDESQGGENQDSKSQGGETQTEEESKTKQKTKRRTKSSSQTSTTADEKPQESSKESEQQSNSENTKDEEKTNKTEEKSKPKPQPSMQSYIKPKIYDDVKKCVENKVAVLLTGEAGTGKNEMCKNISLDLGLDFYFCNAINDIFQLTGYGNADGEYVKTQFYDFCTKGGVFMFDEIDASDPQALIVFNSAIANGYFDFPVKGRVQLNENCRFIACANTKGQGASLTYVGRNQLDAATLDRFVMFRLEYDKNVEKKISNNNSDLVDFIECFRDAVNKAGSLQIITSYRAISAICKLENVMDLTKLLQCTITKHLDKDDIRCICNNFNTAVDNKYVDALFKLGGIRK